jgi:putative nucleotidyltransferase with HDIG domain
MKDVGGACMEHLERLLVIIEAIADGHYSNDIIPLTADDQPEMLRRIAEAMAMMMVKVEAREYRLEKLVEELRHLNATIRRNTIQVVSALATALAARDQYTEGHTARVSDFAVRVARYLEMDEEECERIRIAGILHDIGKIGFPDALFQAHDQKNPAHLVKAICQHPETGAEILKDLDFLGPVLEYVRCHHERPDGKGYPRGLHDADIPLGAKIVAVADSYDAMTTDRPYQPGMSPEVAFEILTRYAGAKWDASCVTALRQVLAPQATGG